MLDYMVLFQAILLLNGVNALSLIFAVVFLKYRSEINMLQVFPDLYDENADQDFDNNVCVQNATIHYFSLAMAGQTAINQSSCYITYCILT